jgi:hypothetical protein
MPRRTKIDFGAGAVNKVLALILGNCAQRKPTTTNEFTTSTTTILDADHISPRQNPSQWVTQQVSEPARAMRSAVAFARRYALWSPRRATKKKLDWEE